MLTSAQESNWREKWFILARSLGYNPSWRGSQGWRSLEQHGACSEEAERMDGCMCSSSLLFIQSRIPHLSSIHKVDHPTSINVIVITAYKHGQRHIFQIVLDSAKLTRLTITSVRDACIVTYCLETSACRGTRRGLDVSGEAPPKSFITTTRLWLLLLDRFSLIFSYSVFWPCFSPSQLLPDPPYLLRFMYFPLLQQSV